MQWGILSTARINDKLAFMYRHHPQTRRLAEPVRSGAIGRLRMIRAAAQQSLGGDVAFTGTMRFPDDVLAHFDAGMDLAVRDELEVVGDAGTLLLEDPWHCRTPGIALRGDGGAERIEVGHADSYMLEAENMSAAIRGDAEPLLGRADAVGQAAPIEALYEAAADGGTGVSGDR